MDNGNITYKNIAVLVDGDNTQYSKMQSVIQKISTYGRIVVKRVYGNWKKEGLKNWENEIKSLAFKAQQQFDYVTDKNATDMALTIDAMDLLYTGTYDAFVIVSSDSDYTPLNIRLKEAGIFVIGVGKQNASEAFKRSCDDFIEIESLDDDDSAINTPVVQKTQKQSNSKLSNKKVDTDSEQSETTMTPNELHRLLRVAADTEAYQDEDGFVNVSSAGTYIKRVRPDFDIKKFGCKKLPEFIKKYDNMYEVKKYKGKGKVYIIAYKCK